MYEKNRLIELIRIGKVTFCDVCDHKDSLECDDCENELIAEYLLANDVATVVHGEWINCNGGNATCSHCKTRQKNVYDDDNEQRFCGHCGAKMDGGN